MQLIYPLVVYNFGPEKSLPRFRFHYEEGEDLEKTATVYRALAEMGHVREKFGVPAPEKDEEVITPRGASPLPSKRTNAGESGPCRCGCQGGIEGKSRACPRRYRSSPTESTTRTKAPSSWTMRRPRR
jgi:hypothetical protein